MESPALEYVENVCFASMRQNTAKVMGHHLCTDLGEPETSVLLEGSKQPRGGAQVSGN